MSDPAVAAGGSIEERFLENRKARDEARQHLFVSEQAEARAAFLASLSEFERDFAATIDVDNKRAIELLQQFKENAANAVQTISLPAFDVKQLNSTLAFATEQTRKNSDQANEKFHFTKGRTTKLVHSTAVAASRNGEALDALQVAGDQFIDRNGETIVVGRGKNAVFIRRCTGCTVFVAPVAGSVFVSDCEDCTFYVACHQLRVQKSIACHLYICCRSVPVIEQSTALKFGPYSAWQNADEVLGGVDGALVAAGIDDLEMAKNAAASVADFSWIKQQASPNWALLLDSQWRVQRS